MKKSVIIIAEAGVNHNGDLNKALSLISEAANAGADYIKFQTFKTENLVHKKAQKAAYQIENTQQGDSQFTMLKQLEISEGWYPKLIAHARDNKIKFLSTGFDQESIDFLDKLGCDFFKVPSGEITNKPYLQHIAGKGKPVIVSTGMATKEEISNAINTLTESGVARNSISVLHCNTQYPTDMSDVNLYAMHDIRDSFNVEIGYSDHTLGIEVPIAAVALGAKIIEKHFTLDQSLPGPDHAASLTPVELKAMVIGIRNIEQAIEGSGMKEPSQSELKNISAARKSIHTNQNLEEGHVIAAGDLIMLRPGNGISPMEIDQVVGKRVLRNLKSGTLLKREDFE